MRHIEDVRALRGTVEIIARGAETLRVRKQDFAANPLSPGQEVDLGAWIDRVSAAQFAAGYEAALSSLDYRAHTAREISATLRRKGFLEPCVQAVVARLRESGLIDDARYAERMAEVHSRGPVGVYAFKRKLKSKGVSDEDAEAALSAFDDEQQAQAARAAAEKLLRRYQALPEREARAKLSQALARRGFGWDAIETALDGLLEEP